MSHHFTRRGLLRRGAAAALGAAVAGGVLPPAAWAIDWGSLFGERMADLNGLVKELRGQATAQGHSLRKGDKVPSGALVSVAEGGRLVISLEDGTIFTLSGGTNLELLLNRMMQGIFNLLAGALLMVVPKGHQYLIAGLDASIGIKGTVVYREVYGPQDTMEGMVPVPPNTPGYVCTCHGEVEMLTPRERTAFQGVKADYHDAYFIDPRRPGMLVPAPMLNHSDEDIRRLVALQEGPRHDISWLRH
jgi:hypothetical protein